MDNRKRAFLFKLTDGFAKGIWSTSALTLYLNIMFKGSMSIGTAQGISGLAVVTSGLTAGCLASSGVIRKDMLLMTQGYFMAISIALISTALLLPSIAAEARFSILCVGLGAWGVGEGNEPVMDALFSDCQPNSRGQSRGMQLTLLYFCHVSSQSLGPLLTAVYFSLSSDKWTLRGLTSVIMMGQLASLVPSVILMQFNEAPGQAGIDISALESSPSLNPDVDLDLGPSLDLSLEQPLIERSNDSDHRQFGRIHVVVPLIVVASNFMAGLALGMAVKFMPIFLSKEVKLAPSTLSLTFSIQPFAMGLYSIFSQWLSTKKGAGRAHMMVFNRILGIACLALIGLAPLSWLLDPWLIVPVVVARTALINSCHPIERGLLMDYSEPMMRAGWASLESLTTLSWSLSAFVGGWLIDRNGLALQSIFVLSCLGQMIALALSAWLVLLVPRKEVLS